ncbi:MAG: hypothetical protein ACKOWF_03765 [Chloroflexota bacterium]
MNGAAPLLSIVVATRHDGYGDRQVERLAAHARSVDRFADALGRPVEHLIVEWAPLPGWAPVAEVLPAVGSPLVTRLIVHAEGPEVEAVNRAYGRTFHEWAAKNAGVRRAAGRFVAVTNQDIIFLPELAEASRAWMDSDRARSTYARCDRVDIAVAPEDAYPEISSFSHAVPGRCRTHPRDNPVPVLGQGVRGFFGSFNRPAHSGELAGTQYVLPNPCSLPVRTDRQILTSLHTDAAGDFILVLREHLVDAGSFAEGFTWRSHLDTLAVCRLWGHGLGQVIFRPPAIVVHVNHVEGEPFTDWNLVPPQMELLVRGNAYPNQPAGWGMAASAFEETSVTAAGQPVRAPGAAPMPAPSPAPAPPPDPWRARPRLADLPLPDDHRALLAELPVYRADSPKVRLGRAFDGGYALPMRVLLEAKRLVSLGVDGDSSFEHAWRARTGKPLRMADGSGTPPGICRWFPGGEAAGVTWTPRDAGDGDGEIPLAELLAEEPGALLKATTGRAVRLLAGADLSGCAALVLAAGRLDEAEERLRLAALLRELNRAFVLVHLHGRNTGPAVPLPPDLQLDGDGLPPELELTFVHRGLHLAPLELDGSPFPVPAIDQRHDPLAPELRLRWVNGHQP